MYDGGIRAYPLLYNYEPACAQPVAKFPVSL